jgi:XapX domain-containing protein
MRYGAWDATVSRSDLIRLGNCSAQEAGKGAMKDMLISFGVGAFVGLLYGIIKVKSPAPPIIALLGLLGMVIGEQIGGWVHTKNASVAHVATTCLSGKHRASPIKIAEQVPDFLDPNENLR